jgi:anti-anti-sigma factor
VQRAPFSLRAQQQAGLAYLRISGDFERASANRVQSVLATVRGESVGRVVFDLSGVTFLDSAALMTILRTDYRGRQEGFDVVVVRPPPLAARVFTLSRAGDQLTLVNHPREAGLAKQKGAALGADRGEAAIQFRWLPSEEVSICVRCRSNPAVVESGQTVGGLMLDSPEGPVCGGCVTKEEQIELGEEILRDLRRRQPREETKIRELEGALAELRDSKPTDYQRQRE